MIKKNIKLFGLVLLSLFFLKMFIFIDIKADDYKLIDIKTVNSVDEMYNYINSDDYTIRILGSEGDNSYKYNQTYCVNIDRPGVLVVYTYNVGGDYIKDTIYNDYNLSEKLKSQTARIKVSSYNYKWKSYSCTFVDKGTYYLNLSGSVYYFENYIAYVYLVPNDLVINIDRIVYNDDNSQATVYINTICEAFETFFFAEHGFSDKDMEDFRDFYGRSGPSNSIIKYQNSTLLIKNNTGYAYDDAKKLYELLRNGIVITKNGTYTVCIKPDDCIYSMFPAWVTFEIDKIGQEANKIEAKSLKMSKTKVTLKPKGTLQLNVTFKPKNVTDQMITWKSSNSKVATVDKNGKVTAKKKGTCVITAISSNGKKAKCKITVKK